MASAPWAGTRRCATTPRSAASSRCSRWRNKSRGAVTNGIPRASRHARARVFTLNPINAAGAPVRTVFGAGMVLAVIIAAGSALADGSGGPPAVKHDDGQYYDKGGTPTYKVAPDG